MPANDSALSRSIKVVLPTTIKRPFWSRPAFDSKAVGYVMYEQGNVADPGRLEQTVSVVELTNGSLRLLRSLVWQKQRKYDGSRLMGVAVCNDNLYGTIRYANDTYGVEIIDKKLLVTIQKIDLANIKFDLSRQGRIDVSTLGTDNWLLIFQKVSATKRSVIICQDNKVVERREIVKQDKFRSCITRIFGDYMLMAERKGNTLIVIRWKIGNAVLNKFRQTELPAEKSGIVSFTTAELDSANYIATLTNESLNSINIYEIDYARVMEEGNKALQFRRRVMMEENIVCLFPSKDVGHILAISGLQLLCSLSIAPKTTGDSSE